MHKSGFYAESGIVQVLLITLCVAYILAGLYMKQYVTSINRRSLAIMHAYLSVANGIVCHSNINITVVLINIYFVAIKA